MIKLKIMKDHKQPGKRNEKKHFKFDICHENDTQNQARSPPPIFNF